MVTCSLEPPKLKFIQLTKIVPLVVATQESEYSCSSDGIITFNCGQGLLPVFYQHTLITET